MSDFYDEVDEDKTDVGDDASRHRLLEIVTNQLYDKCTFHVGYAMAQAPPKFFDVDDEGHGCVTPVGETTLKATTDAVNYAINYCRSMGIRCLLVDVKGATGFPSPTIAQRFDFISEWAATSAGRVLISVVARPEMILEDKFGVLIAANRGLVSDVFSERHEAVSWLKNACKRRDQSV